MNVLAQQCPVRKSAMPIRPEILTVVHYLFIGCRAHPASALSVSGNRGHRDALNKAMNAGAVKIVVSTRGPKPKKYWVLTEEAKVALKTFRPS